ncbi:MAG TPA: response regulator [Methylococcaceae bacterium]|jgi:FixJ family two-component response regulator|nr:response regulator [Methylococcaceae bacterium]
MRHTPALIAVVDDEASVARALRRLIRSLGFDAEIFDSGPMFLAWVREHRPDCIILDIHMPQMSGFEVKEHLEADHRGLPLIFITASDDPDDERRARQANGASFLHKPFTADQLCTAIRAALGKGISTNRREYPNRH